jgi:hypothetical protein
MSSSEAVKLRLPALRKNSSEEPGNLRPNCLSQLLRNLQSMLLNWQRYRRYL